jgi:hypothetical protein
MLDISWWPVVVVAVRAAPTVVVGVEPEAY